MNCVASLAGPGCVAYVALLIWSHLLLVAEDFWRHSIHGSILLDHLFHVGFHDVLVLVLGQCSVLVATLLKFCGKEGMQRMKAGHLSHVIQIYIFCTSTALSIYLVSSIVCMCTCCVAIAIGSEHGELRYSKVYSLAIEWSEIVFSNRAPYYISHGAGSETKSLKALQKNSLRALEANGRSEYSSVRNVWIEFVRRKDRVGVWVFEN